MCRACRYLRQTICKKISANHCVQKANLRAENQKQTREKCKFCRFCKTCKNNFCSSGFCHTYGVKCCLCVVSVRYLRQTICKKNLCQPLCAKGKLTCRKSKTNLGKIFFPMQKNGKQQISFFVVEVFVLQKYKSKNNNDFLENAFIMSFSVFISAFFVQFGCI